MTNDRAILPMENEATGTQTTPFAHAEPWKTRILSQAHQQFRAKRDRLDLASRPAKIESQKHFVVPCSDRVYTFFWVWIFLTHMMLAAFCLGLCTLNIYALDEYSWFKSVLPSLGHIFDDDIGYGVVVSMIFFGLQHIYILLKMINYSARAKQLTLRPMDTKLSGNQLMSSPNHSKGQKTSLKQRLQVFSVKGRYFDVLFDIREIIEISLQCRQAYQLSLFLPIPWLNTFSVAIVVINCWSTPLFRNLLRRNLPLERLICLLVDVCLDFSSSVLIPLLIFWPYYRDFFLEEWSITYQMWYSSTWVIKANSEIGLLLINTWPGLVSQVLPRWSMISCLTNIGALIERQSRQNTRTSLVCASRSSLAAVSPIRKNSKRNINEKDTEPEEEVEDWMIQVRTNLKARMLHIFLFGFGCGILIIAFVASFTQDDGVSLALQKSCLSKVHPWFSTKYSCAVLLIDGHFHELTQGCNGNELDALLAQVNPITVASLTLSNCNALEIPPVIHDFHQLFWLEIYHSHLKEWSKEAGLTEQFHPRLNLLYLVHTTFEDPSTLPDGLVQTLPPSLKDIEIFDTNLNALPENLDEIWIHPIDYLYVERANLVRIPFCIVKMALSVISFAGNLIESLENLEFEEGQWYYYVSFANNTMLSILPESFYNATFLNLYLPFTMVSSNISQLPSWILDPEYISANQVELFGTPFCDNLLLPLFEQEVLETEEQEMLFELVISTWICEIVDVSEYIFFPLAEYDEIRGETERQLNID